VKEREPNNKRRLVSLIASVCILATMSGSAVLADGHGHGHPTGGGEGGEGGGGDENGAFQHVLLLSIDGFHAVDYLNCVKAGTCPNLAALGKTGVNYLATSTSKPSDSFPGLTAIISGGSPRTEGAFYDSAYDRSLDPPAETTGNGLVGAPGLCTSGAAPTGTATEYEEGIDFDQTHLNGISAGSAAGDGGVNSIKSTRLPRDPANNCNPVFPWNFVRTNTVFGVIHQAHGYTAWSDKHPAYASVSGPGPTAGNIDDFYGPEINSLSSNFETDNDIPVKFLNCSPKLPDQLSVANGDDYTGSFQNIQCYDAIKVQAILNEIDGMTHNASGNAPVPNILGMNFQAVSVGQKLVYQLVTPFVVGGYLDGTGTPSPSLASEIAFVDKSIGLMVTELNNKHLLDSTLIIVTAKHGQSPIDPNRVLRISGDVPTDKSPTAILGPAFLPDSKINGLGPTEDDVSLLWLKDSSQTAAAVALLESDSPAIPQADNIAGIGQIFWGASILPMFNAPGLPPNGDPRTPDIIVTPDVGVIYTGHQAKVAEHGGFANDDTNVIMLLSNPHFKPSTVSSPVETMQVAPTILSALGLDPRALQAVQIEGTQVLPGVQFGGGGD
jgi:hypothetical protein